MRHYGPILDVIGKHESRGDYGVVYGGIPKADRPVNLTAMTVRQVLAWQADVRARGAASTAAGKYQIIFNTLRGLGGDMTRRFDAATQDSMAVQLLNRRGFQSFLDGRMSTDEMTLNLAKEWASLPVPATGRSYYDGDGLNMAHASVAEVRSALRTCKAIYNGVAIDDTRPMPKPDMSTKPGNSNITPPAMSETWGFLNMILNFLKAIFGGRNG